MTAPTSPERGPWILIVGLLLGAGLLVVMTWDSVVKPREREDLPASPHIVELTNANWQKEVIDSEMPVLVDFTATWCAPCQRFAPTVHRIAERYHGKAKIGQFDVGPNFVNGHKLLEEYGFGGIPHILIFKGGELRAQLKAGELSEAALANALDRVIQ